MRRLMKQWRWWSSLALSSLFLGMPILSADQTLVPPSARRLFQLGEHLHVREHVIARRSQSPTLVSPHEHLRHDAISPHLFVDSSPLPITLLRLAFFFFQLCCDDFWATPGTDAVRKRSFHHGNWVKSKSTIHSPKVQSPKSKLPNTKAKKVQFNSTKVQIQRPRYEPKKKCRAPRMQPPQRIRLLDACVCHPGF